MISLIAAISNNSCIGKNGKIPWHIPADMKQMKELTIGKNVIMGRKTYESIPDKFRPLPNRTNIVITSNSSYDVPEGVEVYGSIAEAILEHEGEDIVGFGGQRIYEDMIKMADTLYITHVDEEVDGCDAFFPSIYPQDWEEIESEDHEEYVFVTYKRKASTQ